MDKRKLRFPEYDGDRITVRLRHRDRKRLRSIARQVGMSESDLVREAIDISLDALLEVRPDLRADALI